MYSQMNDIEKLYSPSQWSHRLNPDEVLKYHIDFVTKVSRKSQKFVPNELNISYGNTDNQKLDIYGGDSLAEGAPWFVYIHGGYWQELSRDISANPVDGLIKHGIRVAILGYDLCPSVTLNDIVTQIRNAAIFCLRKAKSMGAKSVYFGGHSAGAHLASMLITDDFLTETLRPEQLDTLVSGICLISGIYHLDPIIKTSMNNLIKLTEPVPSFLSPINQSYSNCPNHIKFLVVVGEFESPAFIEQSERFAELLNTYSDSVYYKKMYDYDHFNIVEDLNDDKSDIVTLIKQKLFGDI